MELKIVDKIQKIRLPRLMKIMLAILLILLGILFSFVPIIPGSIFLIAGAVLMIPGRKVISLIKIRKGLVHLVGNFSRQKLKYKIYDIKTHVKHILKRD